MVEQVVPENLTEDQLRTLYQVSTWINSTLDFDNALDNAMDAIMQVTRAQRGYLMIHNEENGTFQVVVARNIDGETIDSEAYSTTIVGQVAQTLEPLLTNNAAFDNRFSAGQSIIMQGLRAIMAAPMLVFKSEVDKRLVGVVYVDTSMKAGTFRPNDMGLLQAVSGLAARAIENARLYKMAAEKGRLEHELQMAHDIQSNLMPNKLPVLAGYDMAPHWESAREVAGDFWDAFQLENDSFGAVVADVSDKGAPAALFMAVARTLIRSHARAGMTAVETVGRANDLLTDDAAQSGMFVTLYFSRFELGGHSVHVNGGHNPPAVYRHSTGNVEFMPIGGRALGWFPDNPVEEVELQLDPGDIMVTYTDGLTEAENPEGEAYGEPRLSEVMARAADLSAEEIKDAILYDLERFCDGRDPFDDVTMMVVKYTG